MTEYDLLSIRDRLYGIGKSAEQIVFIAEDLKSFFELNELEGDIELISQMAIGLQSKIIETSSNLENIETEREDDNKNQL